LQKKSESIIGQPQVCLIKILKMKQINMIFLLGILMVTLFSCTPEQIIEDATQPQACCDESGPIIVPPPPPPPPEDFND
jgi:hypothetical protein